MIKKSIPIRTCIGCKQKVPQEQLIRVNLNEKDRLVILKNRYISNGRSIYLCPSRNCIEKALRNGNIVFNYSKYQRKFVKLSDYECARFKFRLFKAIISFKETN